jgi:shikimate dehydrogenase/3-dehydroquinate dehydratase type I
MSLIISLAAEDFELVTKRLTASLGRSLVSGYELRLDRTPADFDLAALVKEFGPFVATCLPVEQGGLFEKGAEAWTKVMQAAASAGANFVDVPLSMPVPDLPSTCLRVHSVHEKLGTWLDLEEQLQALVSRAQPGDVCKVVAWAGPPMDARRAIRLYQIFVEMDKAEGVRLIAFAQGPGGRASRIFAPSLGAPWTYMAWPGEALAPGQWELYDFLPEEVGAETSLLGVVGKPTHHSRSPLLWNTAFRQNPSLGGAVYQACEGKDLESFMKDHQAKVFRAFSVTTPFKDQVLEVADAWTEDVETIGAGNLLLRKGDIWVAHNTDGVGAMEALEEVGLKPGKLLILGAGGAARAVLQEALKRSYQVSVGVRTPDQVKLFADVPVLALDQVEFSEFDGIVQATPVGSPEVPGNFFGNGRLPKRGSVILDLVYHPAQTDFLTSAQQAGATAVYGASMLLHQMLAQFQLVTGETPPIGPLRALLEADLQMRTPPIFLLGMRGVGKSTLGKNLASALSWPFIDADTLLVERHQKPLTDWIEQDEAGFRQAEADLLEELFLADRSVIALGGGVIESPNSLGLLRSHPQVLALHAPLDTLTQRQSKAPRPPLTKLSLEEEVAQLWQQRASAYDLAAGGRWFSTDGEQSSTLDRLVAATRAWHAVN